MTTRVQKMTRVLIYAYFNPSCVKAVGGGGARRGLQELHNV